MKYKHEYIYTILAFIYIFSFNFQNLQFFPEIGSISMIGEYYLLPVSFLICIFNFRKIGKTKISKIYKYYILYFIILNVFINIYFYFFYSKMQIYETNVLIKSIQLLFHFIFQLISLEALYFILKHLSFSKLKMIMNLNYLFLFFYFIYEKYILKEIGRVKLLTSEPGAAGFLISIIFFIVLFLNKNNVIKIFIFLLYIVMMYFVGSKGAVITFIISFGIWGILNFKKNKISTIILSVSIILIFKFLYYEQLLNSFVIDIKKFTSLVTRSWSIISAIGSFLIFPFGSGGAYLVSYSFIGKKINDIYITLFPNLNYSEINYMLSTGVNLTPKSGFFFGILISGIGYTSMQTLIFKFFINKIKENNLLLFLIINYCISNLIYSSDIQAPIQILIYSFLLFVINKKIEK